MIIIQVNERTREIEAKGHGKLAIETGEDIVCSAVSTALKTTVNILANLKQDAKIGFQSGYLYMKILNANKTNIGIFKGLIGTLQEISKAFPKNATLVFTPKTIVFDEEIETQALN